MRVRRCIPPRKISRHSLNKHVGCETWLLDQEARELGDLEETRASTDAKLDKHLAQVVVVRLETIYKVHCVKEDAVERLRGHRFPGEQEMLDVLWRRDVLDSLEDFGKFLPKKIAHKVLRSPSIK